MKQKRAISNSESVWKYWVPTLGSMLLVFAIYLYLSPGGSVIYTATLFGVAFSWLSIAFLLIGFWKKPSTESAILEGLSRLTIYTAFASMLIGLIGNILTFISILIPGNALFIILSETLATQILNVRLEVVGFNIAIFLVVVYFIQLGKRLLKSRISSTIKELGVILAGISLLIASYIGFDTIPIELRIISPQSVLSFAAGLGGIFLLSSHIVASLPRFIASVWVTRVASAFSHIALYISAITTFAGLQWFTTRNHGFTMELLNMLPFKVGFEMLGLLVMGLGYPTLILSIISFSLLYNNGTKKKRELSYTQSVDTKNDLEDDINEDVIQPAAESDIANLRRL